MFYNSLLLLPISVETRNSKIGRRPTPTEDAQFHIEQERDKDTVYSKFIDDYKGK